MQSRIFYSNLVLAASFLALFATAYVFTAALKPSQGAKSNAAMVIDISELKEGELKVFSESAVASVMVLRRSKKDIERLAELNRFLRDPTSEQSQQPDYAKNLHRSLRPEYFVAFAYEPRRGVPVTYHSGRLPHDWYANEKWHGGFHENYDGAIFDKAGRVYMKYGHLEEQNTPVPEYRFESETKVVVEFLGIKT